MAEENTNLTPDEMAALRDIAAPEESAVSPEEASCVKVHTYNFRQPGRLSSAQLRALKVVHEFFAKRLSEERPSGLNLSFELGLLSVETVSYSNYMGSVANPCFLAQLSSHFEQAVLMEIDLPLMRMLVGRILGDEMEPTDKSRGLTSIEQAIAEHWLDGLLPLLAESWALSVPVDFGLQSIEGDPRFVQVMPDDSPVVVLTFGFRAGSTKGTLTLCYPLEPLQQLLEGMSLRMSGVEGEDEAGEHGGDRTLDALKHIPFELRSELGRSSVSASQLASLRVGDVLCLDRSIQDPVEVLLGNNVVFRAELGRMGGNLALRLIGRCSAE